MEQFVAAIGWLVLILCAFGVLLSLAFAIARLVRGARPPQILGAELPVVDARIDLNKRYDLAYGAGGGAVVEKLACVQILGYLRSDRDQTTGEYMEGGWLVIELPDERRAYLRPRFILWLLETASPETKSGASGLPKPGTLE